MTLYPIVILAGGLATRMRPITEQIPKALIDVGGEPFISHQLRLLRSRGVLHVIISTWYLGEMIQDYVGDGSRFGVQVQYVFDGDKPLGTAGAVRKALTLLNGPFFVLNGDTYFPCDFAAVQIFFDEQTHAGLMSVNRNELPWHNCNVELMAGEILRYDKQSRDSKMQHVDAGLGLFDPLVFSHIEEGQPEDMGAVMKKLLDEGKLLAYEENQRFYEIGSFDGLKELDRILTKEPNRFL